MIFSCGQWLAREMGDGEIVRTLTPQTNESGAEGGRFDQYYG